jgi:hypothetical protein
MRANVEGYSKAAVVREKGAQVRQPSVDIIPSVTGRQPWKAASRG